MKIVPISPKKTNVIDRLAALKRRLRKIAMSIIGCFTRRSQTRNSPSTPAPIANALRMVWSVQPFSEASIRPHTTVVSPTMERTAPTMSMRGASGSRDSGTRTLAKNKAPMTIGMFTRKTLPQLNSSSSRPPTMGPNATPRPETPAQTAIALGRSRSGKMFIRIERVAGMMPAAPTPIRARAAISSLALPDIAAHSDPAPKTSRPSMRKRRRPKRSPRVPPTRSSPAKTSR
jgi:hypothetical protein